MVMRLSDRGKDRMVFTSDPPDTALPDVEVIRKDLDGESFMRAGKGKPTLEEFNERTEKAKFPDDVDEIPGTLGTSNPDVGFGLASSVPDSPLVRNFKKVNPRT